MLVKHQAQNQWKCRIILETIWLLAQMSHFATLKVFFPRSVDMLTYRAQFGSSNFKRK